MYNQNFPTGRTRTVRRQLAAIDEGMAWALGRPAQAHILIEDQVEMDAQWESCASSGHSLSWVTVAQRRESIKSL